jgi:phage shock protein A
MSMINKQQFDELVANTTTYLQEHSMQIAKLNRTIAELEARLKHMEERKKPGPKPKVQAA